MLDWKNTNPLGYWMIVRGDKRKDTLSSGIILTQKETYAESIGFYTASILKMGDKVLDFINTGREEKLTEESISKKKILIRYYFKDVIQFEKEGKENPVFMVHIADPSVNILALLDNEQVDML
jgi:site-specific recombinase XerD